MTKTTTTFIHNIQVEIRKEEEKTNIEKKN